MKKGLTERVGHLRSEMTEDEMGEGYCGKGVPFFLLIFKFHHCLFINYFRFNWAHFCIKRPSIVMRIIWWYSFINWRYQIRKLPFIKSTTRHSSKLYFWQHLDITFRWLTFLTWQSTIDNKWVFSFQQHSYSWLTPLTDSLLMFNNHELYRIWLSVSPSSISEHIVKIFNLPFFL